MITRHTVTGPGPGQKHCLFAIMALILIKIFKYTRKCISMNIHIICLRVLVIFFLVISNLKVQILIFYVRLFVLRALAHFYQWPSLFFGLVLIFVRFCISIHFGQVRCCQSQLAMSPRQHDVSRFFEDQRKYVKSLCIRFNLGGVNKSDEQF